VAGRRVDSLRGMNDLFGDIIKEELNVKALRYLDDASEYIAHKFKPQLRTLGPRYGKLVPKITEALNTDATATMAALKQGTWQVVIDGTEVVLTMDDVLVESLQKEGFAAASEHGVTVVLNTQLTPALIEEGTVRELISKWQNMRREAGYEVTDRIRAGYQMAARNESYIADHSDYAQLGEVITRNQDHITEEILADQLESAVPPEGAYAKDWNINGEAVTMWVLRG